MLGRFLLAHLYLNSLMKKTTEYDIRNALERLPTGYEAYDQAYEEAMVRIENQDPDGKELAKRILLWIVCARRPLMTRELQHALAVKTGDYKFNAERQPDLEDVVSVCAALVTIDEESSIIRLIHYTTQEYFERTQKRWFLNAETNITTICVTYLSFRDFENGFCQTEDEFKERLRFNPLYGYAARNWGHHARAASIKAENLILDFLKDEAKTSASSQAMMASEAYIGYNQRVPWQMTGIHLTAYFGLSDTIIDLLGNGHDPNVKDTYGRTPLSWAAENGHETVVRLLLAREGVDANSEDDVGRTPLSLAAEKGHEAIVKLLFAREGVDANSGDLYDQTPLLWAIEKGHKTVVKLLLAREGVDVNVKNMVGQTPLRLAIESGQEALVKALLAREGIDPNSKDFIGRTALSWAAGSGHRAVVKLLLAKNGIDLDSKDNDGRTPLWWAARNGYEAVVKLLLAKKGIDPNSKDDVGRTPLSWVVDGAKDNYYGLTLLPLAAESGHEVVFQLLLDLVGVNLDSKDKDGWTPLSWAARNGHEAVVKLLLGKDGVDVNYKDQNGRTPLLWAAMCGHEAVVRLLLAMDEVDVNLKD